MLSTTKKNGSRSSADIRQGDELSDVYFALVRAFPLRPIRSAKELDRAIAVLLKLSVSEPEQGMDAGKRDYIEALSTLVHEFEQKRRDSILPRSSPLGRLKFLMREREMTAVDLGRIIGNRSTASMVFQGKRGMSMALISKLARHFAVSPAVFID